MTLSGLSGNGHRLAGRYRPMSEINVTPLVDVMLVLLVVFMVAAPLLTVGVPVDLPQAQAHPGTANHGAERTPRHHNQWRRPHLYPGDGSSDRFASSAPAGDYRQQPR